MANILPFSGASVRDVGATYFVMLGGKSAQATLRHIFQKGKIPDPVAVVKFCGITAELSMYRRSKHARLVFQWNDTASYVLIEDIPKNRRMFSRIM